MSPPLPPAGPAAPPHRAGAGGLLASAKSNPKVIGGAVVVVLVVGLGLKNRGKIAPPPAGASSTITPGAGGVYDSTATDQFNALEGELAQLRASQASAAGTATDTGSALPTAPTRLAGHAPVARPVQPASSVTVPVRTRPPSAARVMPPPRIIVN